MNVSLILANCNNHGIGKDNTLPWKLKGDLQYFKKITSTTENPEKKML